MYTYIYIYMCICQERLRGTARGPSSPPKGDAATPTAEPEVKAGRGVLRIGGVERPIKLEHLAEEVERRNELVREVRTADASAASREISRQAKLKAVRQDIAELGRTRMDWQA